MMTSTTLVDLFADCVLSGRSGSMLARSHPASSDAPATPAPETFKNSLRVNVRFRFASCAPLACPDNHGASLAGPYRTRNRCGQSDPMPDVIQVKPVYNLRMSVFRYGREHFEEG